MLLVAEEGEEETTLIVVAPGVGRPQAGDVGERSEQDLAGREGASARVSARKTDRGIKEVPKWWTARRGWKPTCARI